MVLIQLQCRGATIPRLPSTLDVPGDSSVNDVCQNLASILRLNVNRLRLRRKHDSDYLQSSCADPLLSRLEAGPEVVVVSESMSQQSRPCFYVKDLGPQAGWRAVFLLEYLGPLVLHPLLYLSFGGGGFNTEHQFASSKALVLCTMLTLHFIKRELETLFVHSFSQDTMPLKNLYKNCFHYWFLGGANIAYWNYCQGALCDEPNSLLTYLGVAIFLVGEVWNFDTHLVLSNLRKRTQKKRLIPHGHGFDFVTCPNYLAELISLVGVWVVADWSFAVAIFVICSATQMLLWARRKEKRYRDLFGTAYVAKSWSMIPGLR